MISFVLPIFNMEKYLGRCLESIKSQTYPDFEVWMVNDGSSDRSETIAKSYLDDDRFNYVYQVNSGVSTARNKGIELSTGDWIAFVDPDDFVENDYLEILIKVLTENTDVVSCCCKYNLDGEEKVIHFYDSSRCFTDDKKDLFLELMDTNYGGNRITAIGVPWAKLFRRTFLIENNLRFPVELLRYQDNIFNMWAFNKAREIIYIDEPKYVYSSDNIRKYNKKFDKRVLTYADKVCEYRHDFLIKHGLMGDMEIRDAYHAEILYHITIMLKKYFTNEKNTLSITEKVKELDSLLTKDIYQDALNSNSKVNSGMMIRRILLKKRLYKELFFMEKLFDMKRKWVGVNYRIVIVPSRREYVELAC